MLLIQPQFLSHKISINQSIRVYFRQRSIATQWKIYNKIEKRKNLVLLSQKFIPPLKRLNHLKTNRFKKLIKLSRHATRYCYVCFLQDLAEAFEWSFRWCEARIFSWNIPNTQIQKVNEVMMATTSNWNSNLKHPPKTESNQQRTCWQQVCEPEVSASSDNSSYSSALSRQPAADWFRCPLETLSPGYIIQTRCIGWGQVPLSEKSKTKV